MLARPAWLRQPGDLPATGPGGARCGDPAQTLGAVRVDFVNGTDGADGRTTSLRTFNQTQSIFTRPGYDDVTGVGSPIASVYVNALGKKGGATG